MADQLLRPSSVRTLLAHLLDGAAGGTQASWAKLITIERLALHSSPQFNSTVVTTGTEAEQDAIWRPVAVVREEHPYVAW